jgi:hypothetical protein
MKTILACLILPALGGAHAAAPAALAAPAAKLAGQFAGQDISGTYDCTGEDAREGKYTGTVTLALVKAQSTGEYGAYSFSLDVPGFGVYKGQAAVQGAHMAVHFALPDQATHDYGTGIATLARSGAGKWSFTKYYYEPEFKDGNHGIERCVQR